MLACDTLIRNVKVIDGSGGEPHTGAVAIAGEIIAAIDDVGGYRAKRVIDGAGHVLTPGFIDVHTHDDIAVLKAPAMLPKLSQGVTTVITGNCGISAAPVQLGSLLPDPMNLLGERGDFVFSDFRAYVSAVNDSRPSVNVAALVGHTALRNNHLDHLDRSASANEVAGMQEQLREALSAGALGLSTGLAYLSAFSASTEEVMALAQTLMGTGAIYTTHLRSESEHVLEAIDEALHIAKHANVPVVVSHLKCAGLDHWGRSGELLKTLDAAGLQQDVGCDCYPYAAGSSTLDLRQVDERLRIQITWSEPHPAMAGRDLQEIANLWQIPQIEAAKNLQPAGAIYHSISEEDMQRILRHPRTMIGSDGLPNDPRPHPRLWGTFPRVLGRYSRELQLFPLAEAIRKMTSLPAGRFRLAKRGLIRAGYKADLVLFDPDTVNDIGTFTDPAHPAAGIEKVWVNGTLSYANGCCTDARAGTFISRQEIATS